MDSFMKMLSTQALMLIYMCVGYYCNKKKMIDKPTEIKLTDFVLSVTMPCMVFNSFNMKLTVEFMKEASFCLAVSFLICAMAWLSGKFVYNKYPQEKKSILQYATLVNNAGFLGLPIVSSVLGEEGLVLGAIFIIPNRIFMWTAGVFIFSTASDKKKAFFYALLSSVAEPLGALCAYIFFYKYLSGLFMGAVFSFIAGIMMYICAEEMSVNYGEGTQVLKNYLILTGICFMCIVNAL